MNRNDALLAAMVEGITARATAIQQDLTDPATLPNPQIKALIDVSHQLCALAFGAGDEMRVQAKYAECMDHVNRAISSLMEAKNIMAGEV